MILNNCIYLTLSLAWEVSGASIANVYVRNGQEIVPPVKYGAPSYAYGSPPIAQLTAANAGSLFPFGPGYDTPCIPNPCYYPDRTIASMASVDPSDNIIAYQPQAPRFPVVYSPVPGEQSGYEYTYTIYNTGDQKLRSELSDGESIHREYSFLQPDGLVRQVQYVTDDEYKTKDCLPDEETNNRVHHTHSSKDTKSEPLIEKIPHHEISQERHNQHNEITHNKHQETDVESVSKYFKSLENKHHKELEESMEDDSDESHEYEKHFDIFADNNHKNVVKGFKSESKPAANGEETHVETNVAITAEYKLSDGSAYVPYNDLIKCIQAAMTKLNGQPSTPRPSASPLTYLVFNKPC